MPVSWPAIAGVPKSKLSSIKGTMLRRESSAVSISRRSQSPGSPQRSSAERVRRMRKWARSDVLHDDALEIAAGDAYVVEEHVVAMLGQVLENRQRLRRVGAAIAEENGFFDSAHIPAVKLFA